MIKMYGAPTVALTVNTGKMNEVDARAYAQEKQSELGIPVVLPLEDGVDSLVPLFRDMIEKRIAQV